jgi:hypothetical protein
MKRVVLGAALALAIPGGVAEAKSPTKTHRHAYERAYHRVVARYGHRAPGRNIDKHGLRHGALTDARLVRSTRTLRSMVATGSHGTAQHPVWTAGVPAQLDALAQCVKAHESGGDPQAVNGQYEGEGQWSPSAWAAMGGTKYAPTPLQASGAQQDAVLASESDATLEDQQGQYDGC